jgi:hypothetical protein
MIHNAFKVLGAWLFILVIIFYPGKGFAQLLNVESYRSALFEKNWKFQVNLGLEATKKETSVININSGAQLYYRTRSWTFLLLNDVRLIRADKQNIISSGFTHGRLGYWIQPRWALEAFGQFQYDAVRGLQARWLAGTGIRHALFSRDQVSFFAGTGLMYEEEEWEVDDLSDTKASITQQQLKSTSYISGRIDFGGDTSFRLISYYQAPWSSFLKPRLTADAQFEVGINKHLTLAVSWVSTYDYAPVRNVEPFIYTLSNKIIAEF